MKQERVNSLVRQCWLCQTIWYEGCLEMEILKAPFHGERLCDEEDRFQMLFQWGKRYRRLISAVDSTRFHLRRKMRESQSSIALCNEAFVAFLVKAKRLQCIPFDFTTCVFWHRYKRGDDGFCLIGPLHSYDARLVADGCVNIPFGFDDPSFKRMPSCPWRRFLIFLIYPLE